MRAQRSIAGNDRPAIAQFAGFRPPRDHHRLDGKRHAGLQRIADEPSLARMARPPVWNLWLFMHAAPDAMAGILAHDAVTLPFDKLLDCHRNVRRFVRQDSLLDADVQRLFGHVEQPLYRRRDFANAHSERRIADKSFMDRADIKADDVAL